MEPIHFVIGLIGALVGAAGAWAFLSRRIQTESQRRAAAEARYDETSRLSAHAQHTFQALSAEALHTNSEAFLRLAQQTLQRFQEAAQGDLSSRQQAIHELVGPLQESLRRVDGKLHELETARKSAYVLIEDQMKTMAETQTLLRAETANLVRALRAPATRGRWGEIQLRRVVELAGMTPHCDFREQPLLTTDDGRLRPDMVIDLPGGRQIAIDSKVPLEAYLDAIETSDDTVRTAKLRHHAQQMRTHLQRLASKSYWEHLSASVELVVAFVPGDALHQAALDQDPSLFDFAISQRILIATPTSLVGLLKAVSFGWRQEKLAENAQQISELGKEIYDRLGAFVANFAKVGESLGRAVDLYNKAAGTLESRVLVSARRIAEKGVSVAREIPSPDQVTLAPRAVETLEVSAPAPM